MFSDKGTEGRWERSTSTWKELETAEKSGARSQRRQQPHSYNPSLMLLFLLHVPRPQSVRILWFASIDVSFLYLYRARL